MNEEPIFLLGAHKSGTSLLRNIFDGHSELFVIPIEAHFFQHLGYWIDYGIRRKMPRNLTEKEISENFISWIVRNNTFVDEKSDSVTKGFWDVKEFKKCINASNDVSLNIKYIIENYICSMYRSLYESNLPENFRIVEKSVDHAEFAMELKKLYPKAKFIHIVRNPYSNLVSIRKYKSKNGYPFLKSIINSLYNNYYFLYKNKRVIGDDYLVIKYEDLVEKTDTILKEITVFLDIEFEDILNYPTVNGNLWKGNSTSNEKFEGISSSRLHKWEKEICPLEINIVNKLFKFVLDEYDYKYINSKSILLPAKNENAYRYVLNRLLYKYYL